MISYLVRGFVPTFLELVRRLEWPLYILGCVAGFCGAPALLLAPRKARESLAYLRALPRGVPPL